MRGDSFTDHAVTVSVRVAQQPKVVWRVNTDPAALVQWYAPGCRWEIPELRAGATVRFHDSETDVQVARIERCEAPASLVLRWTPDAAWPGTFLVNSYSVRADAHVPRAEDHA